MVLRSPFFEYLHETLYKHALEHLEAALSEKKGHFVFLPTVNVYLLLTFLKACDRSGHIFGAASASPRSLTKKLARSPFSTAHGGQHDTKYVTFELLLHAAFVADNVVFLGFMLGLLNQLVLIEGPLLDQNVTRPSRRLGFKVK